MSARKSLYRSVRKPFWPRRLSCRLMRPRRSSHTCAHASHLSMTACPDRPGPILTSTWAALPAAASSFKCWMFGAVHVRLRWTSTGSHAHHCLQHGKLGCCGMNDCRSFIDLTGTLVIIARVEFGEVSRNDLQDQCSVGGRPIGIALLFSASAT